MKEYVLNNAKLLQGYAEMLLAEIEEDKFYDQTAGIPNHPAWVVGHIATSLSTGLKLCGKEPLIAGEWGKLFGKGSTVTCGCEGYPGKTELVDAMRAGWAALSDAYVNADDSVLEAENPYEPMRERFPKVGHMVTFLLTGHPAVHLGQVSSWRRAAGYGSAM